ncbi:MAG: methyltransferase family protein [Myxococcota bacterium]
MVVIYAQLAGIAAFVVVTLILGLAIRRTPTKEAAFRLSRISHAFFWGALMAPLYVGVVWPGLTHFDELLGLPSLPFPIARWVFGVPLLVVGTYFTASSIQALRKLGAGLMAFKLTQQVVAGRVYERVRNPMSLGMYLQVIAVSLLAGSTALLLGSLFALIPAHAFNLVFFEERELSARHGPSYDEYRRQVPFLLPRLR